MRTYEVAAKQGLNYSVDTYRDEYRMLEVRSRYDFKLSLLLICFCVTSGTWDREGSNELENEC